MQPETATRAPYGLLASRVLAKGFSGCPNHPQHSKMKRQWLIAKWCI